MLTSSENEITLKEVVSPTYKFKHPYIYTIKGMEDSDTTETCQMSTMEGNRIARPHDTIHPIYILAILRGVYGVMGPLI